MITSAMILLPAVKAQGHRLLAVHPLRAADALQLAAAIVWAGSAVNNSDFICLDTRLRNAAQLEGFTVYPA